MAIFVPAVRLIDAPLHLVLWLLVAGRERLRDVGSELRVSLALHLLAVRHPVPSVIHFLAAMLLGRSVR